MTEPRILTLHPIPASAEATEQKLREIRENTPLSERMDAWRTFAKLAQPKGRAAA